LFSGNPEDATLNFFLLASELKNLNEIMRQQIRLTEKNLQDTNLENESKMNFIKTVEATYWKTYFIIRRITITELNVLSVLIK
jgi:hypothetical protein